MDVVVTRINDRPLLLRNSTAGAGNWLELKLAGSRSNRDGIGASIAVTTDAGTQWNRVTTAVGYSSSSDRIAHFGLGRDNTARVIEIHWPSGEKQRCTNVPANRMVVVREQEGCRASE
jgi:hypothetical protein